MAKRKLSAMLGEMELTPTKGEQLMKSKLSEEMFKQFGKDFWLTEDGQEILLDAAYIPEIVPKHYIGKVLKVARNPRYVYAHIVEIKKKVPVVIPPKWAKRVLRKMIKIEAITDTEGTTYRYVR
tara:strand:- start:1280 stop:1651 length:372 start_codon:yes stop_codon:yes gene_type:complete